MAAEDCAGVELGLGTTHDPQTCPICAPILVRPAYRAGVERAERTARESEAR